MPLLKSGLEAEMRCFVPCAYHKAWHTASIQWISAVDGKAEVAAAWNSCFPFHVIPLWQTERMDWSVGKETQNSPGWEADTGDPQEWGCRWLCYGRSFSFHPRRKEPGAPGI